MMVCFLKFTDRFLLQPLYEPLYYFFKNFCCPYPTPFWFHSQSFLLVWARSWKMTVASQCWEFLGVYHSSSFRNSYTRPLHSPAARIGPGPSCFLLLSLHSPAVFSSQWLMAMFPGVLGSLFSHLLLSLT